jgi:hypothetical protein
MDDLNDDWSECDEPKLLGKYEAAADLLAGFFIALIAAGFAYTFSFPVIEFPVPDSHWGHAAPLEMDLATSTPLEWSKRQVH